MREVKVKPFNVEVELWKLNGMLFADDLWYLHNVCECVHVGKKYVQQMSVFSVLYATSTFGVVVVCFW